MPIDREWFQRQVDEYGRLRPKYGALAEVLEQMLGAAVKRLAPAAFVQARAKQVPSFANKALLKRAKYHEPSRQLTDLCGARVICHTRAEVEQVGRFIRENFLVDEANSEDTAVRLKSSEFGYRSVHYIVELKPNCPATEAAGVSVPAELLGLKAEIQVRTIAQHAWADIGHDRLYKSDFKVPEAWRREAARIAALLESADEGFARLVEAVDSLRGNYDAYLDRQQMADELERLSTVLAFDGHNEPLVRQIVRLAMAMEDWPRVVGSVEEFAGHRSPALDTALGFALCQLHKSQRHGHEYAAARQHFERAIEREPKHLEAVLHLADSWAGIDDDRALDLYEQAFKLAPDDPRTLAAFLARKVARERNLSAVSLVRPSIEAAVARCAEQARMGINLPWAWYWRAMFQLVLERPYAALDDLCRAIDLSTAEFMLDGALETLGLLSPVQMALPALDWGRRLLLLAKAVRYPKAAIDERLSALGSRPAPEFRPPIVIVAGGCDAAVEERILAHRELLQRAFEGFQGTVISGGTTAGVSGLIGELAKSSGDRLLTIGYLPHSVPAEATVDRRYQKLLTTAGSDFSALEPLQNWIDLIVAGISPERVIVLGINGGTISRFEYQLALTLGAQVGVLRESGRAASQLAQEFEVERQPRLALLPDDAMTWRTFIEQELPGPLTDDQRERAAQAIHEEYRRNQRGRLTQVDAAMVEWEELHPWLRRSNLQQADHIQRKLAAIGMHAVPVAGREITLIDFTPEQVERMAEMEHARWNVERLLDGWSLGERDPAKKCSPYLVGWEKLPENVRDWDRQTVRAIPAFLAGIGLEVQCAEL